MDGSPGRDRDQVRGRTEGVGAEGRATDRDQKEGRGGTTQSPLRTETTVTPTSGTGAGSCP